MKAQSHPNLGAPSRITKQKVGGGKGDRWPGRARLFKRKLWPMSASCGHTEASGKIPGAGWGRSVC